MKRIRLIPAALCLVMIAILGTGVVAAQPSQPDNTFDVTYNGEVVGHAVIHTAKKGESPTYSLVMRGLPADKQYIFGYNLSDIQQILGMVSAVPTGAIIRHGTIPADDVTDMQPAQFWVMERPPTDGGCPSLYGFYLDNLGSFVAKIACYYSTDGGITWHESDHVGLDHRQGWASLKSLGVPDVALVKFHAIVVGGKDRTDNYVYNYDYSKGVLYHSYHAYYIEGVTWNPTLYDNHCVIIN